LVARLAPGFLDARAGRRDRVVVRDATGSR
jgi:hypothetical protein